MTNTIEKNRVGLNSNQLRILAVCYWTIYGVQ